MGCCVLRGWCARLGVWAVVPVLYCPLRLYVSVRAGAGLCALRLAGMHVCPCVLPVGWAVRT